MSTPSSDSEGPAEARTAFSARAPTRLRTAVAGIVEASTLLMVISAKSGAASSSWLRSASVSWIRQPLTFGVAFLPTCRAGKPEAEMSQFS